MTRLFGTDGIRGTAGRFPLDAVTVERIGAATVHVLRDEGGADRLVLGRDTRESGPWLEEALVRGIRGAGAEVTRVGVLPTPAVAYLTVAHDFAAGIVISASHNPFEDNGIKVFSGRGHKSDERFEADVERRVGDAAWVPEPGPLDGHDAEADALVEDYATHAGAALGRMLPSGFRVAVDCANGATYRVAPAVLRSLGADVTEMGTAPTGRNINLACGSTAPQALAETVRRDGYQLGIAFDGDGDRAILVDERGHIVDGDAVMYVCARHMQDRGLLKEHAIVATVMSNIGLELALGDAGITVHRCPVGDKHVMAELVRRGLSLGGEQSGHVILPALSNTGDGLVTALQVVRAMIDTGRTVSELTSGFVAYPQVLVNVRVRSRQDLDSIPAVASRIREVDALLAGRGRLLVRYSGTEPLLRVMIEGEDQARIEALAQSVADEVARHLG